MAIAKNPPSTAAFANRLITRLVIQHAPPTLPSSSFRFTLSSRPSALRDATSADPLLLAFQSYPPNRFWPSSRGAKRRRISLRFLLLARAQTARLAPAFFYFPLAAKIASNG